MFRGITEDDGFKCILPGPFQRFRCDGYRMAPGRCSFYKHPWFRCLNYTLRNAALGCVLSLPFLSPCSFPGSPPLYLPILSMPHPRQTTYWLLIVSLTFSLCPQVLLHPHLKTCSPLTPPLQIISSVTQSYQTLCNAMGYSMPGFPVHHQLLELIQTHVHRVGDATNNLILYGPLLLLPSVFPSIRVFSNDSVLHIRCPRPKYWSFSFSISPSNEYSGLISFRMDWLDLAVQGTLKSLLQYHSLKASVLQCSTFFIVQLLYPYVTTGKTIALTRWTFVGKVMSLLFNRLSRLVITFLPRSKCLLISWLQSPSAVILEPKNKNLPLFPLFTHLFTMKWWDQMPWS